MWKVGLSLRATWEERSTGSVKKIGTFSTGLWEGVNFPQKSTNIPQSGVEK